MTEEKITRTVERDPENPFWNMSTKKRDSIIRMVIDGGFDEDYYDDMCDRVDACGVESLTEDEQAILNMGYSMLVYALDYIEANGLNK